MNYGRDSCARRAIPGKHGGLNQSDESARDDDASREAAPTATILRISAGFDLDTVLSEVVGSVQALTRACGVIGAADQALPVNLGPVLRPGAVSLRAFL